MHHLFLGIGSFAAMELVSYLMHRYVYHGFLWVLHRSHHTPRLGSFELNDLFPLFFSAVGAGLFMTGFHLANGALVAVAAGVSAYGALYFIIHDLYIHRRGAFFQQNLPLLRRIRAAHEVHHRFGGEPYGLLFFGTARKVLRKFRHD
jgi:beta-carotene 3-hydroxylase